MTNTELAIQKAVEGGWDGDAIAFGVDKTVEPVKDCWKVDGWWYTKEILLDPLFWQALGKTEGYGDRKSGRLIIQDAPAAPRNWGINREIGVAELLQHRLIDAIQQGRSIDDFFGEILKK